MSVINSLGPKATPGTTGHKGQNYQAPSQIRPTQSVAAPAKASTYGKIPPHLAAS